jgi:tetratricopeptide (TPR) repeat protein
MSRFLEEAVLIYRAKNRIPHGGTEREGMCATGLDDREASVGWPTRLGRAWRVRGAWSKCFLIAVFSFSLSIAMRAVPPPAPYAVATAEFESGRFQEASATLESALRKDPGDASLELLLARCYYELKDWDRAALHAQSAEEIEPRNAEAHVWLGQIYGRKAEQQHSLILAVRTREEFQKAVALDRSNIDARRDLMEFYLDAPWLLGGGKDKAKKQAKAIAALNPAAGALARGQLDEKNGDLAKAEGEFRRVVDLKPPMVGPYLEAADFFESRRDVTGMRAAVTAARKINPSDPRLSYYQGVLDVLQGANLGEAERELRTYVAGAPQRSTYPSRASALSWLGQLYERSGKPQLAAQQYQAALQLDPGLAAARQALDRLKRQ